MQKRSSQIKPKTTSSMPRIRPPRLEEIKEEHLNSNKPQTTRDRAANSMKRNQGFDDGLNSNKPQTTRNDGEATHSKIPRNVNFYRHLINDKYSSENDIEWVLKLRSQAEGGHKGKLEQTSTQPFSFDGRGIEAQKLGRTTLDLDTKNHLSQVQHLFLNRMGATPSQGCVYFETGLRSYGSSSDKLRDLERNWRTAAKKDRHDYPTLYPSNEETLKIKTWSTKNLEIKTHTAFDGNQNYPKYDELYDRQTKNVSTVRHVLKTPGKLMATADWELSMRHYGDKTKPREYLEHAELQKTLGQLKKIGRKGKEEVKAV